MAGSIKDAVAIYKIVHELLHFESAAPQGGVTAEGTVQLCQRLAPHRLAYKDPDGLLRQQYGGIYELYAQGADPIAAMELWLRDTLRGSAALASLVGTRINPGPLMPGTTLPAVTFALLDPSDVSGAGGVIVTTRAQYRVCVEC
jgi:hypothetical protein